MVGLILMSLMAYVPYEVWWPMLQGNPQHTGAFQVYRLMGIDSFYVKWWTDSVACNANPAIADIDGDGRGEIVITSTEMYYTQTKGFVRTFKGSTGTQVWKTETGWPTEGAPAVADADDNGNLEVIYEGGVLCANTGTIRTQGGGSTSTLADIDGDNKLEILTGDGRALSFNGSSLVEDWNSPGVSGGTAVGDVTGGSYPDVVVVGGHAYALEGGTGSPVWSADIGGGFPAIADIDADGEMEIAFTLVRYGAGGFYPGIYVLNNDGTIKWGFDISGPYSGSMPGAPPGPPALGDVDGDDKMEVICGGDSLYVWCLNSTNGSPKWKYKLNGDMSCSPVLVDLDNDGILEIVIGDYEKVYGGAANVSILKGNGSLIWTYRFAPSPSITGHAIGDVDGDGCLEIAGGGVS
ncbi:MAG: VCBS repeat-containing protein [Candidatus Stahlbacteria bacterium]|nr:VCBS repeat-containing protein [Candidatus Stahlbacteria bacterium]